MITGDEVFVKTGTKNVEDFTLNHLINTAINSEEKKINVETVEDFTDPLQCDHIEDEDKSKEKLSVAHLPFSNSFKKTLDDTVLCISPYLRFSVPYLETELGKKCKLRKFFPSEIYYSEQFDNNSKVNKVSKASEDENENLVHSFTEVSKVKRFPMFYSAYL